jgi:hypothetical protein
MLVGSSKICDFLLVLARNAAGRCPHHEYMLVSSRKIFRFLLVPARSAAGRAPHNEYMLVSSREFRRFLRVLARSVAEEREVVEETNEVMVPERLMQSH